MAQCPGSSCHSVLHEGDETNVLSPRGGAGKGKWCLGECTVHWLALEVSARARYATRANLPKCHGEAIGGTLTPGRCRERQMVFGIVYCALAATWGKRKSPLCDTSKREIPQALP